MNGQVVKQCRRTWRRLGVPRAVVADMTAELTADLETACQDGRDPQSYVGGNPAGFARAWASERGVVPVRPLIGRVATVAIVCGLPAAFMGLFVAYGLGSDAMADAAGGVTSGESPTWLILVGYVLSAVFAWAGMLGGVSAALRFHGDAARRATVRRLAFALPAAGLVAATVTIGIAARLEFPFGVRYLLAESLGPALFLASVVALVRWSVVRSDTGRRVPERHLIPD
ncbi:hypothetical protein [Actinomadura hibisca]|uniref:hypothetical protein n=1 Tax=Actinomadura hibisca TaxID=68565 RepID=UPI000AC36C0C|nr:hypothetical protein [Actinomadura hibisca]